MIDALRVEANSLEEMLKDGIEANCDNAGDDYIDLYTTNPILAKKYDLQEQQYDWEDENDDMYAPTDEDIASPLEEEQ